MARKKKSGLQKAWEKLHAATKAIVILCLIAGIAAGAAVCLMLFDKDHFTLLGEKQFSLTAGEASYVYTEQGVEAVCFGRDVTDKLTVTLSKGIVDNGDGSYTIPTDTEGVYTITYTVDCYKFGADAPNGGIKRIRVFTVDAAEADGKSAGLIEEGSGSGT